MSRMHPDDLAQIIDALAERSAARAEPARLLDAEQAAALLNVPTSWMRAQARANRVPHVPVGRYVRFDADALEAWWRDRQQGPVPRSSS